MKEDGTVRSGFVLPLPRFVLHPLTAVAIAAVHVYLAAGHLAKLADKVEWTDVWKGFGALAGAYVFLALASRRMPVGRVMQDPVSYNLEQVMEQVKKQKTAGASE